MSLVILRQDDNVAPWIEAINTTDSSITVYNGNEVHPKDDITMALVWKHRKGSLLDYPNLQCIASMGAGIDFIIDDTTTPTHLPITRVVDPVLASDMSEHVLALIFAYLKNLQRYQDNQYKKIWKPKPYRRISDCTVGILGLGALGSTLAKDLVQLGFNVNGWSQSLKTIEKVNCFSGPSQLADFLSTTEVLVCLLPLTAETKEILNAKLFMQLPKGAYLINVARGGHLVDVDVLQMLANGQLSGASLDVFHQEPLAQDHPFWEHPKIQMTPHCASVSDTQSVVPQILENYQRLCENKTLLHVVSRKKGY